MNLVSRSSVVAYPAPRELAFRLGDDDELLAGHEVGGQVYLVHDAVTNAGVTIQAFNANHLRSLRATTGEPTVSHIASRSTTKNADELRAYLEQVAHGPSWRDRSVHDRVNGPY